MPMTYEEIRKAALEAGFVIVDVITDDYLMGRFEIDAATAKRLLPALEANAYELVENVDQERLDATIKDIAEMNDVELFTEEEGFGDEDEAEKIA